MTTSNDVLEPLQHITNFLAVSDRIGSSGQPEPHQFEAIKNAGYQVVINLALPSSTNALPNEGQLVSQLGMTYIHIPVIWETPTQENFRQFLAFMQSLANQRVWVHCALNMRVSCFLYLYRIIELKTRPETAAQDLEKIWQPNVVWQGFMELILEQNRS